MKLLRRILILILAIPILIIMIFITMLFSINGHQSNDTVDQPLTLYPLVLSYKPYVTEKAKEHGIDEYVDLILAVMQVESGGCGTDPMQASESGFNEKYPRVPNGIQDPHYSIDVGVQELAHNLKAAKVQSSTDIQRIKVALGGYNFGSGFISWLQQNHEGIWTLEAAMEYSSIKAKEMHWEKYGDPPYADKVMRYYTQFTFVVSDGEFIWPIQDARLTQDFGANEGGYHFGMDISAWYGAAVYAPHNAKVVAVSQSCPANGGYLGNWCPVNNFASGGGNYIQLEVEYQDRKLYIIMLHMKDIYVSEGQTVKKGQAIGTQGNSGNSSGSHMHVEIHENTNRGINTFNGLIDPKLILGGL